MSTIEAEILARIETDIKEIKKAVAEIRETFCKELIEVSNRLETEALYRAAKGDIMEREGRVYGRDS